MIYQNNIDKYYIQKVWQNHENRTIRLFYSCKGIYYDRYLIHGEIIFLDDECEIEGFKYIYENRTDCAVKMVFYCDDEKHKMIVQPRGWSELSPFCVYAGARVLK